jgi:hypothetical protein
MPIPPEGISDASRVTGLNSGGFGIGGRMHSLAGGMGCGKGLFR